MNTDLSKLIVFALAITLLGVGSPSPAFALRAVGLEEGTERDNVARELGVPVSKVSPRDAVLAAADVSTPHAYATALHYGAQLLINAHRAKAIVPPPDGAIPQPPPSMPPSAGPTAGLEETKGTPSSQSRSAEEQVDALIRRAFPEDWMTPPPAGLLLEGTTNWTHPTREGPFTLQVTSRTLNPYTQAQAYEISISVTAAPASLTPMLARLSQYQFRMTASGHPIDRWVTLKQNPDDPGQAIATWRVPVSSLVAPTATARPPVRGQGGVVVVASPPPARTLTLEVRRRPAGLEQEEKDDRPPYILAERTWRKNFEDYTGSFGIGQAFSTDGPTGAEQLLAWQQGMVAEATRLFRSMQDGDLRSKLSTPDLVDETARILERYGTASWSLTKHDWQRLQTFLLHAWLATHPAPSAQHPPTTSLSPTAGLEEKVTDILAEAAVRMLELQRSPDDRVDMLAQWVPQSGGYVLNRLIYREADQEPDALSSTVWSLTFTPGDVNLPLPTSAAAPSGVDASHAITMPYAHLLALIPQASAISRAIVPHRPVAQEPAGDLSLTQKDEFHTASREKQHSGLEETPKASEGTVEAQAPAATVYSTIYYTTSEIGWALTDAIDTASRQATDRFPVAAIDLRRISLNGFDRFQEARVPLPPRSIVVKARGQTLQDQAILQATGVIILDYEDLVNVTTTVLTLQTVFDAVFQRLGRPASQLDRIERDGDQLKVYV